MEDRLPSPGRGRLLAATPDLKDPNFDGTVILLLEHGVEGTVGIVLNRPSDTPVTEALGDGPGDGDPRWEDLVDDIGLVHVGGPVQPNALVALARVPEVTDHDRWQPVIEDIGVISLDDDADLQAVGQIDALRIYAGYSGWSEGQLEAEIASGAWFVVPCRPSDPFTTASGDLWTHVLRRQGGMFTTVTPNPAWN